MIYLFSGTPGSGKSLHQARILYDRIRWGHPTIVNYSVNQAAVKHGRGELVEIDNSQLQPEFLESFSAEYFKHHRFKEGKIAVFIDESQLLFNAREWAKGDRKAWTAFFSEHRKLGYDVYLVAQFDRMLDRQIRSLIEYEIIHRKVSNFGIRGWLFSAVAGGNLFCAVKVWYPLKERVGVEFFKYKRKYSRLYDSYKMFRGDEKPVPAPAPAPAPVDHQDTPGQALDSETGRP